jgi:hypothetical protein
MSSTSKFEVAAIAPELLKLGHAGLDKFSKAWRRYVNICKERNAVLLEGQKMIPASLVSCIDPDLLQNLVWKEKIEGCDDADNVTDVGSWCVVACLRLQIWCRYRRGRSGYILFQFPEISSAELAAVAAVV